MIKQLTILAVLLISFSSCSDDNNLAKEFVGTYSGSMFCTTEGSQHIFETVTITEESDNEIDIRLTPQAFPLIGKVSIDDEITMTNYMETLSDNIAINMLDGVGFKNDGFDFIKSLSILYDNSADGVSNCMISLVEKI